MSVCITGSYTKAGFCTNCGQRAERVITSVDKVTASCGVWRKQFDRVLDLRRRQIQITQISSWSPLCARIQEGLVITKTLSGFSKSVIRII